jgi:DHA1 family L-arabinose/isopropyl-beta-D-thiogalactopyranoside export protein-like MFS transporter
MAFAGSCLALFLLLPSSALMIAVMLVIAFWGVCYTSFNVSMQNEVLKVIPNDSFAIVMALFSALYNVGIATGTIMGGLVTDSIGIQYIGVVGGCFIAASTMLLVFYLVGKMRAQTSTA